MAFPHTCCGEFGLPQVCGYIGHDTDECSAIGGAQDRIAVLFVLKNDVLYGACDLFRLCGGIHSCLLSHRGVSREAEATLTPRGFSGNCNGMLFDRQTRYSRYIHRGRHPSATSNLTAKFIKNKLNN